MQVDWVIHRQSSVDEIDPASRAPLNEDRVLLRRGRLAAQAEHDWIGARLELDANTVRGPTVRPFEAFVFGRYEAALAGLTVRAGLGKIPFGFDATEPDTERPFLERGLGTRAFFGQARDLGVALEARYRFVRLSLALTNGEPLSDDRYAGLDLTRHKDFVGHAGVGTPTSRALWVQAGVSCLFGKGLHLGTPATKAGLQWVDGNEDGLVDATELVPVTGVAATPSEAFDRTALGADLRVAARLPVLGTLTLRAELTRAQNLDRTVRPADPVASGRALRELSAQLGAAQELTRYAELAIRYDLYEPDADATRSQAGNVVPSDTRFRTWSFALSGKLPPGRLVLEYDHQRNQLGRSASGVPTTLEDDALTLRAEARFD